jgi:predicted nucleic acid-binding protein
LEAAVEGQAQYVVTGDTDLLDSKAYRDIRIVRPAAFLPMLRARR